LLRVRVLERRSWPEPPIHTYSTRLLGSFGGSVTKWLLSFESEKNVAPPNWRESTEAVAVLLEAAVVAAKLEATRVEDLIVM
jgi:hypothetical protein